jgi:hypothetical protein
VKIAAIASSGIGDSGVCHFAAFRDPDGNVLILHRRYTPRTKRT